MIILQFSIIVLFINHNYVVNGNKYITTNNDNSVENDYDDRVLDSKSIIIIFKMELTLEG